MVTLRPGQWLTEPLKDSVLIVLNQEIDHRDLFDIAWKSCKHRILADGAANAVRRLSPIYIPDLVVGDFDSIDSESKTFFAAKCVPFIRDNDLYATDFMKAMREAKARFKVSTFLAFNATGGRVDHQWHSILCLTIAKRQHDADLLLVSQDSLTFMIPPGEAIVETPRKLLGPTCGFLPLIGHATVTTHGLRWDVKDWSTSLVTRISTSNQLAEDILTIECDMPLVFTIEINKTLNIN